MHLNTVRARLFPHLDSVRMDAIDIADRQVIVSLSSLATRARCPRCQRWSRAIHSRFSRVVADLPCAGREVVLRLSGCRFACGNSRCSRRTFRERFPLVAPYYQRQTPGFHAALARLGFALGGRQATRLARAQGFPPLDARGCRRVSHRAHGPSGQRAPGDGAHVGASCGPSRATFLRAVRGTPQAEPPTPRVLGVDDWALRKGKTYGTLLVDMERHCPVEMLPDRTAQTFAAWLTRHPGVEMISRDRGGAYADGAQQGAPHAVQVADRFHLVKNLTAALEACFLHKGPALAQAARQLAAGAPPATLPSSLPSDTVYRGHRRGERRWAERLEETSRQRHARRVARHEQIHALRARGLEQQEIGRRLGVSRKTVMRYLQLDEPPPRHHWRQRRGRVLDRYEPYLLQRWEEGCRSGRRLWQEIRAQGYAYSLTNVARFVARLRREGPPPPVVQALRGARRQMAASLTSAHGLSARQAAFLVLRPAVERSPEETAYLDHLCHLDVEVAQAADLTTAFVTLVRERPADRLQHAARQSQVDGWIAAAQASGIASLRRFAQGLRTDYAAVLAGLTLPINNGQLEGHVNRLKTIKRQMFGRANFDLLRLRVLYAA